MSGEEDEPTCGMVYSRGVCGGDIVVDEDGHLECDDCYVVSLLVLQDEAGALFVSHYSAPGDLLIDYQTNPIGYN